MDFLGKAHLLDVMDVGYTIFDAGIFLYHLDFLRIDWFGEVPDPVL